MSRAKPRNRQHGNTMVLALIVMSALATLGTLTVVSVQSSLKASTADRSQALALYAAESGAAIIMDYLRHNFDQTLMTTGPGGPPWFRPKAWSALVKPLNEPQVSLDVTEPTSGAKPGTANNPFLGDGIVAWYETKILNNKDDVPSPTLDANPASPPGPPTLPHPYPGPVNGYLEGVDYDGRVIIQITGHGPQEAIAILEVEVQWPIQQDLAFPPPIAISPGGPTLTLLGWHVVNF
jgi:hypothetical protein